MNNLTTIQCTKCGRVKGQKEHICQIVASCKGCGRFAGNTHVCSTNGFEGKKHSENTRKIMSKIRMGKKLSKETCTRMSDYHKGRPLPIKTRLRLSEIHKKRVLDGKCHLYKGGITAKHLLIRTSVEYKLWRKAVYERDNYTCILCGSSGKSNLEADHIKPFSLFPELVFDINNGRTLCVDCHKKTDTYAFNVLKYKRTDFNFF